MTKDTFLVYERERNWENEKEREQQKKYKGKLRRKERDKRNKRIFLSLSQQQTFFLFFLQFLSAFLGAWKKIGILADLFFNWERNLRKGTPNSLKFSLPLKKQKEIGGKKEKNVRQKEVSFVLILGLVYSVLAVWRIRNLKLIVPSGL